MPAGWSVVGTAGSRPEFFQPQEVECAGHVHVVRARLGQAAVVGVTSTRHRRSPNGVCSSPLLVFRGAAGAVGLVERVEFGHVLIGQDEIEDVRVLGDSLAVGRLGDDRKIAL